MLPTNEKINVFWCVDCTLHHSIVIASDNTTRVRQEKNVLVLFHIRLLHSVLSACLLDGQQPFKFKAHMEFGEVRKSTPEEIEKNQEEVAAQKALDEAQAAKRNAARAAKEASEAAAKAAE